MVSQPRNLPRQDDLVVLLDRLEATGVHLDEHIRSAIADGIPYLHIEISKEGPAGGLVASVDGTLTDLQQAVQGFPVIGSASSQTPESRWRAWKAMTASRQDQPSYLISVNSPGGSLLHPSVLLFLDKQLARGDILEMYEDVSSSVPTWVGPRDHWLESLAVELDTDWYLEGPDGQRQALDGFGGDSAEWISAIEQLRLGEEVTIDLGAGGLTRLRLVQQNGDCIPSAKANPKGRLTRW